jgi:hypothetical protein
MLQLLVLMVAVLALALPTSSNATVNACAAGKRMCVSKKASAILKCHAKAAKSANVTAGDLAACIQKAKDRFDGGAVASKGCFEKLEAKYGEAACLTANDTNSVGSTVDSFVDTIGCALDPATCGPTPTPTPLPCVATPTPPPLCGAAAAPACSAPCPTDAGECLDVGGSCQCVGGLPTPTPAPTP